MLGVVGAFRALGKPVWDIQHGYLGPSHDAYNNSAAFALDSRFKPTGFLVWDENFGDHVAAVLGAPWRSTGHAHLKLAGARVLPRAAGRCSVLYTLQWSTPVPASIEHAVHADTAVDWTFRMHPTDTSPRLDLEGLRRAANVRIVGAEQPLAQAIAEADLHITMNSSVVHEAAVIGVPSIYFDPIGHERFAREVGQGLAQFADDDSFPKLLAEQRTRAAT
jgi:hypothetical protein